MGIFGLIVMTGRVYRTERKQFAKTLLRARIIIRVVKKDRDKANRQIERLLHNGVELTLLWAACRECGWFMSGCYPRK